MDEAILRIALQFGNGTHLNDRSGIGRFGMGLPNASISQCRRVDVWSWQNGPKNALHTYLDLEEIKDQSLRHVPNPKHNPLPEIWMQHSEGIGDSGTLVVWEDFDEHRLSWKGAKATIENTEVIVGRMYRKLISNGDLRIRLLALEKDVVTFERVARANDPLYLISPSSTPEPFSNKPMFQKWGERDETFEIEWKNKKYSVVVRMSWAHQETVPEDGMDRGHKPYGKHAAKNIGVSIVRSGRELMLDPSWANSYDPRERWWGVEVEFPADLDEVFGVTNNKQSATVFSHMAKFDWQSVAEPGESYMEMKERLLAEEDHHVHLIDIVEYIGKQLSSIRGRLADQTKGRRSGPNRHDDVSVEDLAFVARSLTIHFC